MHARFIALLGQPRNPFCLSVARSTGAAMSYYLFIQLGCRSFSTHRWAESPLPTTEGTKSVDRKDFRKIDRGFGRSCSHRAGSVSVSAVRSR